MAVTPTQKATGTQTATLDTNHTLSTITDAGIYVLHVNATNLVAGETLFLTATAKVLTGGSAAVILKRSWSGVLAEPHIVLPPLDSLFSLAFILRQEGGTGRAFEWSISTW